VHALATLAQSALKPAPEPIRACQLVDKSAPESISARQLVDRSAPGGEPMSKVEDLWADSPALGSHLLLVELDPFGAGAIGQLERIFSLSGLKLVNWREYSLCLACYWSTGENILIRFGPVRVC
jgi:hypothetical protein